ncbi:MAG: hypothetical protein ACRDGE_12280 [Candidatus Limnocylindria bacterium]
MDCDACVEACPVDACFAEDQSLTSGRVHRTQRRLLQPARIGSPGSRAGVAARRAPWTGARAAPKPGSRCADARVTGCLRRPRSIGVGMWRLKGIPRASATVP